MANRTVKDAHSVKGTNPQYIIEKIIRSRIYECKYWKEECFALSAELLVDKAMALKYVGGVYGGNVKPTPFICLILKMLQIQPERDIIVEFIQNQDFKYVRALGAAYMRLVGNAIECYKYLEPLYNDYRKIKVMDRQGDINLTHIDEFIDQLVREDRICDIILPRLQKRQILEDSNELEPRVSALDDDLENMEEEEEIPIPVKEKRVSPERRAGYRDLDKPDTRNNVPLFRRSKSPERRERHERRSSRERDREREKRHRSPVRRERKREEDDDKRNKRRRGHHDHSGRDHHKDTTTNSRHKEPRDRHSREDLNVREANELRARLGMAPLR